MPCRSALARLAAAATLVVLAACDQYAVAADPGNTPRPTPQLTPAPAPPADPCTVSDVDPPGVGEILRDADGGCVPPEAAMVVRCDPASPPAIVLGGTAAPRTFLGGPFAVPVRPPAGLLEVGVSTVGRVWRSPSDPRRVFVESSGRWERWLALAAPGGLGSPPSVDMIGDSILDGATQAVIEALPKWETAIDAEVGRGSFTAADIAEALPAPGPDAVVIQIGTNDHDPAGFAENADRILAAVEAADLVIWVTVRTPDTDAEGINDAIRDAVGRVPQGVIADWGRFVREDQLSSDGVHPAPGNEHLMADLLAPLLEGWRAAELGGATGCVASP